MPPPPSSRRPSPWDHAVHAGVALAIVVAGALAAWSPAGAHVTAQDAVANGDGTTTVSFTFDHGCGTSPTTGLAIRVPAGGTVSATAQPAGWTAQVLDDRVDWTGPPIAHGQAETFTMTLPLPARPGEVVAFPAVQRCEQGEEAWIDLDPAAPNPAPFVVATAETATRAPGPPPAPSSSAASSPQGASSAQTGLVVALGAGLAAMVGVLAGRARRQERGDQPADGA